MKYVTNVEKIQSDIVKFFIKRNGDVMARDYAIDKTEDGYFIANQFYIIFVPNLLMCLDVEKFPHFNMDKFINSWYESDLFEIQLTKTQVYRNETKTFYSVLTDECTKKYVNSNTLIKYFNLEHLTLKTYKDKNDSIRTTPLLLYDNSNKLIGLILSANIKED